jgi:hypothetical protein
VYADNPKAWVVPDYLKTGLTNGSFEAGDKDPLDWERVEEDAQHRLFWVEASLGQENGRCKQLFLRERNRLGSSSIKLTSHSSRA